MSSREALASSKYQAGTSAQCGPRTPQALFVHILRGQQLGGFESLELGRQAGAVVRLEDGEAPGSKIQPGKSEPRAVERHGCRQGFLTLIEQRFIGHGAWRDDADHLPVDGPF